MRIGAGANLVQSTTESCVGSPDATPSVNGGAEIFSSIALQAVNDVPARPRAVDAKNLRLFIILEFQILAFLSRKCASKMTAKPQNWGRFCSPHHGGN